VLDAPGATPISRALIVLSYAPEEQTEPATTIRRSLEEAFETAMLHQIRRDVELARLRHPTTDVQLLTPSAPLKLRPLEFDPDAIARVLALGRADAESCLRALGDRSTSEREEVRGGQVIPSASMRRRRSWPRAAS